MQATRLMMTEQAFADYQQSVQFANLDDSSMVELGMQEMQDTLTRVQAVSKQFFLCFYGLHIGLIPTFHTFSNEWEGRGGRYDHVTIIHMAQPGSIGLVTGSAHTDATLTAPHKMETTCEWRSLSNSSMACCSSTSACRVMYSFLVML